MGEKSQPVRLISRVSTIVLFSDQTSDVHNAESSASSSAEDIRIVSDASGDASGPAASAAPETENKSSADSSTAIHRFIARHLPSLFSSEMWFFL